jgi:microcystin-dependent protein
MRTADPLRRAFGLSLAGLVVGAAVYAATAVPNHFAANDPLSAQKLNDNFAALSAAIDALVPPGTIIAYAGPINDQTPPPAGWLLCDGSPVSRGGDNTRLFQTIGTVWGSGDGATTFNLPDLRGRFLRGVDKGAGRDPDRGARTASNPGGNTGDAIGTVQDSQLGSHTHDFWAFLHVQPDDSQPNHYTQSGAFSFVIGNGTTTAAGGSETRPVNAGVHYLIKQ